VFSARSHSCEQGGLDWLRLDCDIAAGNSAGVDKGCEESKERAIKDIAEGVVEVIRLLMRCNV
jgi:hypothetical protein